MPTTEIITIINNSGKVISTGKQLVGIFKEARAAYRDRKDAIKADKAYHAGIQRARTFDAAPGGPEYFEPDGYVEEPDQAYERRAIREGPGPAPSRRRSQDDLRSQASSHRSHRSRRSQRPRDDDNRSRAPDDGGDRPRPALTMGNLKTHSEVSATPPSTASKTYRPPYAETAPRDMQLSRPNLAHAATMPLPPRSEMTAAYPVPMPVRLPTDNSTVVSTPRQSMLVHRPRSDGELKKKKSIDMDLAYGNVPPDLAARHDLDPAHTKSQSESTDPNAQETEALNMIDRIEGLLDEAHCVQHTASSMIANLQENPQAAAAVALTLAELSTLIGKMSPAFLGVLKGGSPAIFALLASPQFLIGTSIAMGVTVVIFGGWKIVKRMREANATKALEQPFEMQTLESANPGPPPAPAALPSGASGASYDEALVLEEEMSTIETWRRGITPSGVGLDDDESEAADIELMSPQADRALRERYHDDYDDDDVDPDDSISRVGMSVRSHRSSRSHRSHRSRRHRSHDGEEDEVDIPERKSSRKYHEGDKDRDGRSEVAESVRSHRSSRSHGGEKDKDGRSEVAESVRSHRSSRSHGSRSSRHSTSGGSRVGLKAIEEGGGDGEDEKPKEKKNNMLRQLFRKMKEREEKEKKEKPGRAMSVLV